jgi:hypothetical protein
MKHWAEEESEAIVDRFIANDAPDDLVRLQNTIAAALLSAYEKGRKQLDHLM